MKYTQRMICYYCGDDTKHLDKNIVINCDCCQTSYCQLCYDKLYKPKDPDAICICEFKHTSKEKLMTEYNLNTVEDLDIHHNTNCDHDGECKYFEGNCDVEGCECYMYYYIGLCPVHDSEYDADPERPLLDCIFCSNDPKKRFYTDSELLYFALTIMKIGKKELLDIAIKLNLINIPKT
jgi:hypothetical protein